MASRGLFSNELVLEQTDSSLLNTMSETGLDSTVAGLGVMR